MTRLVRATCTSSRPGPGTVHSPTTREPGTATARCRCSAISSRLSGARSSKLRPTRESTVRPVMAAREELTCRMRPAHVEHRDPVRRVGDEPLGAGVRGLDVVEPPVLVGHVAQHEQGAVRLVGDAVVQRHRVDRDQPRQSGAEVVGLDDQAAHRLAVEGPS